MDSNGHSRGTYSISDIENGKVPTVIFKDYDNLFRSFYNVPLTIETKNLATVLQDCMGLVNTAETYGALNSVIESVDVALLRQGQILFKSIRVKPIAWANFAEKIRSSTIFKEALIHLVGKLKLISEEERKKLSDITVNIIERKHHEVQMVKQALEIRILSHYPQYLHKNASDNPGRSHYASDVYGWMAMSLFRHWFGTQVLEKESKDKDDGGAAFYHQLAQGGQAYLTREQCKHFHLYAPMTPKGKTVFEAHLNTFKADIKQYVVPLMGNTAQLEIDLMHTKDPPEYLLNAEIWDEDCPWWEKRAKSVDSVNEIYS